MKPQPSADSGAFFLLCWVACIVLVILLALTGNLPTAG